ncbi:MAG TPA: hypothetical protein VGS21_09465, partial [Acidimicrobiales bacterium]|nr:hypothetical protein [Acidimicrobiales bacterium]
MTVEQDTLSPAEERLYAELQGIAEIVESDKPATAFQPQRSGRGDARRRSARPFFSGVASKAAIVLFVGAIAAGGTIFAVERQAGSPSQEATSGGGVLLAGDTGPCAGQAPGCGSPQSSASALAAGHWTTFPSGPLSTRVSQVEVWTGSELIIWGGVGGSSELADGAAYNPATRTWRMLPPSPLSPRQNASAVWTGSEMIVFGGSGSQDNSAASLDDAAAYIPASNRWVMLPTAPIEGRVSASAIWTGRQLIVFG